MTLKEALAFRIQQLCDEYQLNPSRLATISGMDRSTIYSILNDKSKSPEVSSIKKICDGLEISLGVFFSTKEFDELEQEIK